MPHIQVSPTLPRHPKVRAAARILGTTRSQIVGHIISAWAWAFEFSPDGLIKSKDLDELGEIFAHENLQTENLIETFLQVGLLVSIPENGFLKIHDWDEYTGSFLAEKEANRKRQQKWRDTKREEADVTQERSVSVTDECSVTVTENRNVTVTPQYNTIQYNTINTKKKPLRRHIAKTDPALADAPPPLTEIKEACEPSLSKAVEPDILDPEPTPLKKRSKKPPERENAPEATQVAPCALEASQTPQKREMAKCDQVLQKYADSLWANCRIKAAFSAMNRRFANQLISNHGFEDACRIAEYYPNCKDQWFVKTVWDFRYCVPNAQKLLFELTHNIQVTKEFVDEVSRIAESDTHEKIRASKPSVWSEEFLEATKENTHELFKITAKAT